LPVAIALFIAGIAMGVAGALMWAWGVHTGQFRDLEETKKQLFWPDIAPEAHTAEGGAVRTAPGQGTGEAR
jgi:nitrogen fixation-related uncharacterized protein